MIATSKMMNGIERKILTILLKNVNNGTFSSNAPFRVTTSRIPSGKPIKVENKSETDTIVIVCKNAVQISL